MFLMLKNNPKLIAITMFTLFMVSLFIAGGFVWYSPSPVWDTWLSNVDFLNQVLEGNKEIWWQQYFEHRILLTKILTWFNYELSGGFNWLLVAVNYVLFFAIIWLLLKIKGEYLSGSKISPQYKFGLGCFIVAWLCQWMQHDGIIWDVESQMLLAHLLPLCALYWLYKSVIESNTSRHFYIAVGFGLASVFTMGNGILTLPLMALYSICMRQKYARSGLLVALTIIVPVLYLHGLVQPKNHSTILGTLIQHPLGMVQYTLHYIGGPFYHLLGDTRVGRLAALVAGLLAILATLFLAIKVVDKPKENALLIAIIIYILYIFGSAAGTAGGRLVFGVDHALWTTRYATSSLIAWCALLIIYYEKILVFLSNNKINIIIPIVLLSLLMFIQQFKALKSQDENYYNQAFATFSVVMGVVDLKEIEPIHNNPSVLIPIAEKAYQHKISIFGVFPLAEIKKDLGSTVQTGTLDACEGSIVSVELVKSDGNYVLVTGWIMNQDHKTYPKLIRFINNKDNRIVGYALPGLPEKNLLVNIPKKVMGFGFKGYVLASSLPNSMTIQGEQPSCQMIANIKLP